MLVPFISSSKNSAINSCPYSWMGTSVYLTWHSRELPLPTISWKPEISVATKFKPSTNMDLMKLWVLPPSTNIITGFSLHDLDTLSMRGWYTLVMMLRLISGAIITDHLLQKAPPPIDLSLSSTLPTLPLLSTTNKKPCTYGRASTSHCSNNRVPAHGGSWFLRSIVCDKDFCWYSLYSRWKTNWKSVEFVHFVL